MTRTPKRDPSESFIHLGMLILSAGTWLEFGPGWSLIAYGGLMVVTSVTSQIYRGRS